MGPTQSATTVAKSLIQFMQHNGTIQKLHSDQGRKFEHVLIGEVCKMWCVYKAQPYTHLSDGMVEHVK